MSAPMAGAGRGSVRSREISLSEADSAPEFARGRQAVAVSPPKGGGGGGGGGSRLQKRAPSLAFATAGWDEAPEGWDVPNKTVISQAAALSPKRTHDMSPLAGLFFDAIVVPAGGTREDGLPHVWVQERLMTAAALYRAHRMHGKAVKIICAGGGTYHKPNYHNEAGFSVHESTSCAEFLVDQGIDNRDIFKEWSSYDTIANAWFVRREHTDAMGAARLVVITSKFHMPRTKAIFEWVYSLTPRFVDYDLTFFPVRDVGFDDDDVLEKRTKREAASLLALLKTREGITTLSEFHAWFYVEHKAYAVAAQKVERTVEGEVLKSY